MTEAMIIEAVRAAGAGDPQFNAGLSVGGAQSPPQVADPSAVAKFEAAMSVGGPDAVADVDPIPFVSEASAVWRSAQENNQGLLQRIRALCEAKPPGNVAALELVELQYEVMNLSFQQEVVTKVADKSSNAIQTLIKNQ